MKRALMAACAACLCAFSVGAFAQLSTTTTGQGMPGMQGGPGGPGGRPHGPPPEIMQACQGLATGTQVQVTFHDGKTRTITCGEHPHHRGGPGGPGQQGSSGGWQQPPGQSQ